MISEMLMVAFLIFSPTMVTIPPQPDAFNTTSVEGLEAFLKWSQVDKTEYNIDTYNCVNFSSDLIQELGYYGFEAANTRLHKSNGTAITDSMHMIVAVKLSDKIVFIEPQSDMVLRYDELEEHYLENGFTDIVIHDLIGKSIIIKFDGWHSDNLLNMFEVKL